VCRIPLIASILLLGATCATALAAPGDLTYLYGRPDVHGHSDLYSPRGVAEASDGSVLIADSYNHRVLRVTRAGAATTVAGIRNEPGFSGDGGPATQARLRYPVGVAALPDGGFLIADSENNRIRHVSPGGVITTVAGGGYNGDGCDARRASFWWPYSVTAAPGGGFMVADRSLDQVRRVWPDGSITTVAGHRGGPHDVDGMAAVDARLDVTDTSFTPDGSFLLTDEIYNRVRKVALDGTITTVAGNGDRGAGDSGDGGPATAAGINSPHAVAATSDGGFLIAQENGGRIREVSPGGTITTLARWLSYPLDVALLSGGGGVVAETGSDAVMLMETDLRPAVSPPTAFQGTGGYTGACLGLDPSFDGGTVRSKTLTDRAARGVVLQPGGKVVVAGQLDDPQRYQLALERYLPNGELDRSFGTNGLALPGGHTMTGFALGAQPGGKLIAVGGAAVNGVAVVVAARFTPDGQLDTSFGEGGIARAPALDHATAVDFAADGSIAIAGSKVWDPRLARITRDGAVDQSFGSGGFAPGPWEVTAIEALPHGRVVTASGPQLGHTGPPETMTVTRYRRDGSMDTTFAGSGRVNLAPVDTRRLDATALARQPDGRLLVVGQYDRDRGQDNDFPIIAMRLLEDGSIDRSFGDAGVVTIIPLHYRWSGGMYPIGATDANSIAIQPDGKIVMAGGDWAGGGFAIYRLHPDGALDPSFGAGGRIVTWLEGGSSANAVDLHPDGRIVAVGQVRFDVFAATYEAARRPGAPPTQTGNTTPTGAPLGGPAVGPAPVAASGGPAPAGGPAGAKAASAATSILPRLSIASWSRARIRALLRGTWKVTVETPDAGQVLAELLVRGRTVAMGTADVRKPGRTSIRLRRNGRARRLLDGRRRVRATLTVRFRSADSTSATKRSVRFSR
jgi:uncharacterized delta-60 repeat protein